MIKIHRLKQPNKHSGTALDPGKSIDIKGVYIKNRNDFTVHVDTFVRKAWKPAKKSKRSGSGDL